VLLLCDQNAKRKKRITARDAETRGLSIVVKRTSIPAMVAMVDSDGIFFIGYV